MPGIEIKMNNIGLFVHFNNRIVSGSQGPGTVLCTGNASMAETGPSSILTELFMVHREDRRSQCEFNNVP